MCCHLNERYGVNAMKTTILNLFEVFTVLYKLVLASATFNLVHADKTIVADHPIKCCRAAYSCGTVYFAAQGDCNPFFYILLW